jgi:alkylation response protein AidB-like acyl-CoA dehydrogenase
MIPRTLFSSEHELFRDSVRTFLEKEAVPFHAQWEKQGYIDRKLWNKAGEAGMLCSHLPEEYGGLGADFLYSAVVIEEVGRLGLTGIGFSLHSDIVAPYILHYGSEALKHKYLPKLVSGEMVTAIAMTEPGAGSDLQGVKTTAVLDGDEYVINGSKTFITNGFLADLVIVVAKTDPKAGAKGTSLFLVEANTPGFEKGKRLEKVGMKAQDTSELFFQDVRVPKENLLGQAGAGFAYLMQELPQERLTVAIGGLASAEAALQWTLDYTRDRKASAKRLPTSRTPASSWRRWPPRFRSVGCLSINVSNYTCKASWMCRRQRWRNTGAPTCNARCSTSACSCMAVTASCGSTRWPGLGRMRGCSGFMPAPTKS